MIFELTMGLLTTSEVAWYIISLIVCLYVCMSVCQTIIFESLDIGSLCVHIQYISTTYRSSSYMNVIGSRSISQEQSKMLIPTM